METAADAADPFYHAPAGECSDFRCDEDGNRITYEEYMKLEEQKRREEERRREEDKRRRERSDQ